MAVEISPVANAKFPMAKEVTPDACVLKPAAKDAFPILSLSQAVVLTPPVRNAALSAYQNVR